MKVRVRGVRRPPICLPATGRKEPTADCIRSALRSSRYRRKPRKICRYFENQPELKPHRKNLNRAFNYENCTGALNSFFALTQAQKYQYRKTKGKNQRSTPNFKIMELESSKVSVTAPSAKRNRDANDTVRNTSIAQPRKAVINSENSESEMEIEAETDCVVYNKDVKPSDEEEEESLLSGEGMEGGTSSSTPNSTGTHSELWDRTMTSPREDLRLKEVEASMSGLAVNNESSHTSSNDSYFEPKIYYAPIQLNGKFCYEADLRQFHFQKRVSLGKSKSHSLRIKLTDPHDSFFRLIKHLSINSP